MLSRQRLSSVLFFISTVLLMYCYWFQVRFTMAVVGISWSLLAMSRTLLIFPDLGRKKAEIKIGKEIKR